MLFFSRYRIMPSYLAYVFHFFVSFCFLMGLYDVFGAYFSKRECEMSYMFETPQYKQISLSDDVTIKFPRYGLYLYGEGRYYGQVSDLNLQGIPVLFIPGNGGSMKQCRSVASFLLRKAEKRGWNPHFNVFAIDYNEERTAIHGGTLNDQIKFAAQSIEVILELYTKSHAVVKPESVVVVAHSMGGIIARGIFTLPNFNHKTVSVMYTLATPHLHPVISLDTSIASVYSSIDSFWRENHEKMADLSIISVSGGDADFQVHGAVARFPAYMNNSVLTTTMLMPKVWASADHQCAAWCKQLILAISRSLFDMVDANTGLISDKFNERLKVLNHHFVRHSGISDASKLGKTARVQLIDSYEFHQIHDMFWTSSSMETNTSSYYFYDLNSLKQLEKSVIVVRASLMTEGWILACSSASSTSAVDLSSSGYVTPDFKVAKLNIETLLGNGFSRIIFKVSKRTATSSHTDVNVLSRNDSVHQNLTVPQIFSNLWTLNQGYQSKNTLGRIKNGFYHTIALDGLTSIYHAYKVTLSPISGTQQHSPLIEMKLPTHPAYMYSRWNEINVKLVGTFGSTVPVLHVFTDGSTEYSISIKPIFGQFLGQIVRFNWPVFPGMIAFNIMLAFSYQLKSFVFGNRWVSIKIAHSLSAKPYKLQPFINLVKKLYSYSWFYDAWNFVGLPIPDSVRMDEEFGVWFALLPLVMFLFAYELTSLINFALSFFIKAFSLLFGRMIRFLPLEKLPPFISSTIHTVLLAGLVARCSSFALLYICILNFVDLCALAVEPLHASQATVNEVSDTTEEANGKTEESASQMHMNKVGCQDEIEEPSGGSNGQIPLIGPENMAFDIKLSMQLLWLTLAALSVPAACAWIEGHNTFEKDPFAAVAVFSSMLFILHRLQSPALLQSTPNKVAVKLLYPSTIIASIVCLYSVHRLQYFVVFYLTVYVAMQYFG